MNLNSLVIEGKLLKTEKENHAGVEVARFVIESGENAISRFDCEAYGIIAERFPFSKCAEIRIVGKLKEKLFEHKGEQLSKIFIICEHLECLKKIREVK